MNYNPSPKSEFIKNPEKLKRHHEIVQNPDVREHIAIALQEVTRRLADGAPPEMGACAASHLRCLGAHDFVEVFLNLAETPSQEAKKDITNLPGNVLQRRGGGN